MSSHRRAAALLVLCALVAGCGPAAPGKTAGSAGPGTAGGGASGGGSAAPSGSGLTAAQLARIPHFGAPPKPKPITVPDGASAGWYSAIPTDQPVAFITIDDGWTKRPEAEALLRAAHVPVTLFLEINAIKSDPGYFTRLQQAGAVIEAHTISHPELKGKSYEVQQHEICGSADELGRLYGRRPVLFRPPFGDKDATTLKVVHDCGMKAAFYWKETTDKGIVRYQQGHAVKAGDILLMHFRPAFVDDFIAVLQAIAAAGLTPARLEDYIA
ncbi:polysaccharide deacetylase family protein [Dactylosporangium sp. CA-092794]|uniref:polysaccharide deacetylase family protein n=1 Tax=Dactylosporangium sp. CA-092794 TaxID=3239929 RepID=UPI003D8BA2BA